LSITGDFTYRLYQNRNTSRSSAMNYREYPDGPLLAYDTGAGMNQLDEVVQTRNYYSANVYANYDIAQGKSCDTLELTLCKGDGSWKEMTLEELLPMGFGKENL